MEFKLLHLTIEGMGALHELFPCLFRTAYLPTFSRFPRFYEVNEELRIDHGQKLLVRVLFEGVNSHDIGQVVSVCGVTWIFVGVQVDLKSGEFR